MKRESSLRHTILKLEPSSTCSPWSGKSDQRSFQMEAPLSYSTVSLCNWIKPTIFKSNFVKGDRLATGQIMLQMSTKLCGSAKDTHIPLKVKVKGNLSLDHRTEDYSECHDPFHLCGSYGCMEKLSSTNRRIISKTVPT